MCEKIHKIRGIRANELFMPVCAVCGRVLVDQERVIDMEFSFCDEYSCGMVICSSCVDKMKEMLKEGK